MPDKSELARRIRELRKKAGLDKEAAKKALWEEFCAVFDDAWAQQEKWLATA